MTVEEPKHYHVSIASSAVADIKNIRQYILDTFCYEAYAKDFSHKITDAITKMNLFPLAYLSEDRLCSRRICDSFPPMEILSDFLHRTRRRSTDYPSPEGQNVLASRIEAYDTRKRNRVIAKTAPELPTRKPGGGLLCQDNVAPFSFL